MARERLTLPSDTVSTQEAVRRKLPMSRTEQPTRLIDRALKFMSDTGETLDRASYNAANNATFGGLEMARGGMEKLTGQSIQRPAVTPIGGLSRLAHGNQEPSDMMTGPGAGTGKFAGDIIPLEAGTKIAGAAWKPVSKTIWKGANIAKDVPIIGDAAQAFARATTGPRSIFRGAVKGGIAGTTTGALIPPPSANEDPANLENQISGRAQQAADFGTAGTLLSGLWEAPGALFGRKYVGAASGKQGFRTGIMGASDRTQFYARMVKERADRILGREEGRALKGVKLRTQSALEDIATREAPAVMAKEGQRAAAAGRVVNTSREAAKDVRERIFPVARQESQKWNELADKAVTSAEAEVGEEAFTAGELAKRIRTKLPKPELAGQNDVGGSLLKILRLREPGAEVPIEEAAQEGAQAAEKFLNPEDPYSWRQVLSNIRAIRPDFKAKGVYSSAHASRQAMQGALTEILDEEGVGAMKEAADNWRNWKPIFSKAVDVFHPQDITDINLAEGSNLISDVARSKITPKATEGVSSETLVSQGSKLADNQTFLTKLYGKMGLKGAPKEVEDALLSLDQAEREKLMTMADYGTQRRNVAAGKVGQLAQGKASPAVGVSARDTVKDFFKARGQAEERTLAKAAHQRAQFARARYTPLRIALQGVPSFVLYSTLMKISKSLNRGSQR